MKEGDVVLTPISQADGVVKNRPAIILREMPPYRDFLVCGVSTQLEKQVKGFDDVISAAEDDFKASGLRTTSLVRLGFLAVLPSVQIIGAIGSISRTSPGTSKDVEQLFDGRGVSPCESAIKLKPNLNRSVSCCCRCHRTAIEL